MGQHKSFPYTLNPDEIPTRKVLDITHETGLHIVQYSCPDACWREHLDAWGKQWRGGNKGAPQPMPYNHCMFTRPADYGCIPYGCTDPAKIRAAVEHRVRANLDGWDRDLKKTKEGRAQLDRIVNATVEAKLAGKDVDAGPYVACIFADL